MTARLSLTQAQIARAIRAAKREGLVPVVTEIGIALVDPASVSLPSPDQSDVSDYDRWKARKNEARFAKGA